MRLPRLTPTQPPSDSQLSAKDEGNDSGTPIKGQEGCKTFRLLFSCAYTMYIVQLSSSVKMHINNTHPGTQATSPSTLLHYISLGSGL